MSTLHSSFFPRTLSLTTNKKRPSVPDLHNKLLSKSTDQVGLFPNAPALEFYLTTRPQEATTLATYPIGIVHEALVLTGTNSLYDLKTTQPDLIEVTPGTTFSVNEFTLDEPSGQVSWRGAKESAWVAFPSSADPKGFEIKWKDRMFFFPSYACRGASGGHY